MRKVWYYNQKNNAGVNNFGDILTPLILDHFGVAWKETERFSADTFVVGSIIKKVTRHATVLGSGIMSWNDRVERTADYKFVRGPLTRDRILAAGGECPEIYGDAAMLLPLLGNFDLNKKGRVGYTPHYNDERKWPAKNRIALNHPDPLHVAREIASYEKIVSSSLHGIIAAHSLGIPAAWIPSKQVKGDDSKFIDHYRSVGLEPIKSHIDNPTFQVPEKFDTTHIEKIFTEL